MKKVFRLSFVLLLVLSLSACICDQCDTAPVSGGENNGGNGDVALLDNIITYNHINGHGEETERYAYVLFEYEQLKTVKYQVAYIACTCRAPQENYFSVAYIELNKSDGSIATVSYGIDGEGGHYQAGLFGDSEVTYEGVENEKLFAQFLTEEIIGKSQDEINAMEPMHGAVDTYTGATVTPNNLVRVLQSLFIYHNDKY